MRATNGRFTNRLPPDARTTAGAVEESLGATAAQALVIVVVAKAVDAAFSALMNQRQTRRERAAPKREALAA